MKLLVAPTEDFIKRSKSQLAADVSAGSSVSVTLKNITGFTVNEYVVVGYEGSQQAELTQISAISGETATLALLKLSHDKDEPVTAYRYNQRKFYGCTTATGTFIELSGYGSPVTIAVNDPQGTVLEYSGVEGYLYFKATYFNQFDSTQSNVSDANTVQGDQSLRYCSLYAIRKQAGLTNNPYLTDAIVETYRKRAENEVKSYVMTRYVLPLQRFDRVIEVPAIIENVTVLLAAGYMDYQEFGKDGEGVKWLGEARGILNSIKKGNQRLLDSNDQEMAFTSLSNQVQSYPDTVDNVNGPTQHFTMDQKF